MTIETAFSYGLQGFQQAQQISTQAAQDIVKSTAYGAEDFIFDQQVANASAGAPSNSTNNLESTTSRLESPNLTQSLVDLKVAEYQAKASAQVIKPADDALGNILDLSV